MSSSSTPYTVTVLAPLQLNGVKVSELGLTTPSLVSVEDTAMLTSLVGWAPSTTVKVSLRPSSVVVSPPWGETRIWPLPTCTLQASWPELALLRLE